MAIVFNRLNQLLGKKTSDILDTNAQQNPEDANQPQQGALEIAKPSSVIGGNAQPQTGQGKLPGEYTKSNFSSPSKILQANKGDSSVSLAGAFEGDVSKAKNSLQTEADSYMKNLNDKNQVSSWDSSKVRGAVDGGQTEDLSKSLEQNFFDPGAVNFTNPELSNAENLRTQGGREATLMQNRGGNYNRGMARLDSLLFKGSDSYNQDQQKLASMGKDLRDTKTNYEKSYQDALDAKKSSISQGKDLIRNELDAYGSQIRGDVDRQTSDFHSGKKQANAYDDSKFQSVLDEVLKDPLAQKYWNMQGPLGERFKNEIGGVKRENYFREGTSSGGAASQEQKARFDRIMNLLGRGETIEANANSQDSSYDTEGYRRDVSDAMQRALEGMPQMVMTEEPNISSVPDDNILNDIGKAAKDGVVQPGDVITKPGEQILNQIPDSSPTKIKGGTYDPAPLEAEGANYNPLKSWTDKVKEGLKTAGDVLNPKTSLQTNRDLIKSGVARTLDWQEDPSEDSILKLGGNERLKRNDDGSYVRDQYGNYVKESFGWDKDELADRAGHSGQRAGGVDVAQAAAAEAPMAAESWEDIQARLAKEKKAAEDQRATMNNREAYKAQPRYKMLLGKKVLIKD